MRFSGRDHRETILVLFNEAIKDDRAIMIQHFHDRVVQIVRIGAQYSFGPKGFGQFHKVGQGL